MHYFLFDDHSYTACWYGTFLAFGKHINQSWHQFNWKVQNNVSNCSVLDDNTVIDFIPVYCVVVIYAINGVGTIILMRSQFEFIMAQSPDRMRGIMTGLCLTIFGIGALGNNLLITILQLFPTANQAVCFTTTWCCRY